MNEALVKFLVDDDRPAKTMNFPMMHGFLFAIACSPEIITSAAWFPYVFNHSDPNYKNEDERQSVESDIKAVLKAIEDQVSMGEIRLPPVFQAAEEILDNFEEDAFHAHWGRGVLFGHNILSEIWNTYLPEDARVQQKFSLDTLTYFSHKVHAEKVCKATDIDGLGIDTMAETVLDNFELAMASYANIGKAVRRAIDEHGAQHPNA